ncbi:MAG: TerB N-terminal domain-containing protein, partial [Actinomycetota bacterium]
TQFLALIDAVAAATEQPRAAPRRAGSRWPVPYRLRVGLGRLAADTTPVPTDWALTWTYFHPDIHPRTPAERCPAEFEQLFAARYAARHGAGLLVETGGQDLEHVYMAANVGIGQVTVSLDVPDVLQLPGPARQLRELAEECSESLDAYSRYLGRHPGAEQTLAAAALLPPELADDGTEAMRSLRGWLDQRLGGQQQVVVQGTEFTAFWPADGDGGLARADAVALTRLLEGQGIGLEPDVRLGGPGPGSGPVALFRLTPGGRTAMSRTSYAESTITLHLAAAVALADGLAAAAAAGRLQSHIATAMGLAEPAQARMQAHLAWLLAGSQPKLTGLVKRVAALDEEQHGPVGDLLVAVAASGGGLVSPATINALIRSFRLLGLDPDAVYSAVHAGGPGPAAGPVTVRPATRRPPGAAVPPPDAATEAQDSAAPAPATPAEVRLDTEVIEAKLAETAAVSALLGSIFTDPTVAGTDTGPASGAGQSELPVERKAQPSQPSVAGLDAAHSALLRTITARDSWTRAEVQEACAAVGLMPDGALDMLNEAAYEVAGDPLTDGEDPISINLDVAQEMLA